MLNNKSHWFYFNRLKKIDSQLNPKNIDELIQENRQKCSDFQLDDLISKEDNIFYLLEKSKISLELLCQRNLISQNLGNDIKYRLSLMNAEFIKLPIVLCHGDFGPKNIMTDGSSFFLLIGRMLSGVFMNMTIYIGLLFLRIGSITQD